MWACIQVHGSKIVPLPALGVLHCTGRKAGKASRKVWEWGDVNTRNLREAVDYGQATALTRMGALGKCGAEVTQCGRRCTL